MKVPIIVLAAGSSSRMGRAKQLLIYEGKTLLRRAVDTALSSQGAEVIVVLGAKKALIQQELKSLPVVIANNPDWEQGMGSSIRAGMSYVSSDADGVLIMLCDQPKLTDQMLNDLLHLAQVPDKSIVASSYGGTLGVPAFFSSQHFSSLSQLSGKAGAKKLFHLYPDQVQPFSFSLGIQDIDTPEDYKNLIEKK